MEAITHSKYARHSGVLAVVAALAVLALTSERGFAQQAEDETFRLLTFEAAGSGPRLGDDSGKR